MGSIAVGVAFGDVGRSYDGEKPDGIVDDLAHVPSPPSGVRARTIMLIASSVKCERSHLEFYVTFQCFMGKTWRGRAGHLVGWNRRLLFGIERVGAVPVVRWRRDLERADPLRIDVVEGLESIFFVSC